MKITKDKKNGNTYHITLKNKESIRVTINGYEVELFLNTNNDLIVEYWGKKPIFI